MKYRKKPIEVQAQQYLSPFPNRDSQDDFSSWLIKNLRQSFKYEGEDLIIITLEGAMRASPNDYIIKGTQGEIYPCKPDIFEQTYEKVE